MSAYSTTAGANFSHASLHGPGSGDNNNNNNNNNNNHGNNVHDQLSQHHATNLAQSYQFSHHQQQPPQILQQQTLQQPQQQQQQQQQQSQAPPPPPYAHSSVHEDDANQYPIPTATPDAQAKGNRLRKACDSCSIRKVKCDESGPPCRACAALDIPCTFERPSRRRGPPNRHAEAIKKRRLESPNGPLFDQSSPNNAAATLASFSSHAVLSAESICPFNTLELLVDDFFTYIHPLVPFPHEPSFRAAFKHREDLSNPSFLALLASMIGTLVASFPRKPRLHLKAQHREKLFPNSFSLVERCHKVAVEARGPGYLDKHLTVYDAATSYFLGLCGAYTINWRQCRLYFGETLTIVRAIGAHRSKDPGFYTVGALSTVMGADGPAFEGQTGEPIDFIRQEIGRRIFWVMFVGIRSMQQLGAAFSELVIPPPTPNEPYPPFPLEVDDQYIYVSHVDPQPAGIISEITGFNLGIQVYMTCTPLTTMELAYGIDEVFDWNRQRRVLEECLRAVKCTLDHAPRELLLQPGNQPGEFGAPERQYCPPTQDYPGVRGFSNESKQGVTSEPSESRRWLQYEIQKANIYASQLGTRSYIVEKYWNLLDANNRIKAAHQSASTPPAQNSPGVMALGLDGIIPKNVTSNYDMVESHMSTERETIVKDLLRVLGCISQVNMEPNGGSFINKIRQIASTLLDTPRNRKGPLALKAEEYLGRFLDVLMKLERISPTAQYEGGEDAAGEDELKNWADLREYQSRFAASGGFLNEL